MAVSAEQDNWVEIPNGTAAVSAENVFKAKAGHWSFSGKAEHSEKMQPLFRESIFKFNKIRWMPQMNLKMFSL